MNVAKISPAFPHSARKVFKSLRTNHISRLVPSGLPSQRILESRVISDRKRFRSLITLVSLLVLWIGPPAITPLVILTWIISILITRRQASNTIITVSQRHGKPDTQTSPVLSATHKQITRNTFEYDKHVKNRNPSGEWNEEQLITNSSPEFSRLAARFSERERDLRSSLTWKERQQRAARAEKLGEELRVQDIYAESIDTQHTLRQQLHVSRAREQKSHADLLAAEQERERLKSRVSTLEASDKKLREREEIVATATARCVEVEANASKLRADLMTAKDWARNLQEQLDRQTRLASSKGHIIQSITEQSRLKLEVTEDEIAHLRRELRHEHNRRLRETKELLDERAKTQDRHEAEMHRIMQEARDAQDQLATYCRGVVLIDNSR